MEQPYTESSVRVVFLSRAAMSASIWVGSDRLLIEVIRGHPRLAVPRADIGRRGGRCSVCRNNA